jgi:hypothetical protein
LSGASRSSIIGIQPLDIVALADRKGLVSGRCCALVGLGDDGYLLGGKPTSNGQRLIPRAIVNDDDLFPWPCLAHR